MLRNAVITGIGHLSVLLYLSQYILETRDSYKDDCDCSCQHSGASLVPKQNSAV